LGVQRLHEHRKRLGAQLDNNAIALIERADARSAFAPEGLILLSPKESLVIARCPTHLVSAKRGRPQAGIAHCCVMKILAAFRCKRFAFERLLDAVYDTGSPPLGPRASLRPPLASTIVDKGE